MDFNNLSGTFPNAPESGFQMDGFNWLIDYNHSADEIEIAAGAPVSTPTPEPSSLMLLIAGMAGLMWALLREKRLQHVDTRP